MILDLITMQGNSEWTPAQLFLNGEVGFWLDSSDLSTLFQDSVGATPVTGSTQPVGLWKNKLVGQTMPFDIFQATSASRPQLEIASGKSAISWDAVDDELSFSPDPLLNSIDCSAGATMCLGFAHALPLTTDAIFVTGAGNEEISVRSDQDLNVALLGRQFRTTNSFSTTAMNTLILKGKVTTDAVTARLNGTATVDTLPSRSAIDLRNEKLPSQNNAFKASQFIFINRIITADEVALLEAFMTSKH